MPTLLILKQYNHFAAALPFIHRKLKKAKQLSKSANIGELNSTFVKG
jgi:hypothetical protein